uniref:Uncharacterized protein n=1 Tax=Arundo donax TaxID=35708 RepID=A0A0A8XXF6_ARUDO
MNQDAQRIGSGSIQSICCPPVTHVVGIAGVEPVSSHLLAACMEEMVQLQRTHSEPGKILAIHWKK